MYRLVDSHLSGEQQRLLQELIDAIPDPIFIKDTTGKYLACNRAFERLTGVATDAIQGKTAQDLFPAPLAESFMHRDQELFHSRHPVTSETWVAYPDGRRACFEVLRTTFLDEAGEVIGLIGICRDVTERKWSEAALQESEHRFHDIMEFAPIGTGVADLTGRFIEVNQALCQLLGYNKAEMQQFTASDITHPEDRSRDTELKQRLIGGELSSFQLEKRLVHKDGHAIPVLLSVVLHKNSAGRPMFFIGQVQDMSEHRAAIQRDHLMSLVLANVFDGVITIDARGIIGSFNLAAEKIFGYRAEEVIGKNVSLLMPQPFRSAHDGYLQRYQETGQRKIIGIGRELSGVRKNGEVFPLELAVSEMATPEARHFIGVVRDITARKEAEEQIRYLAYHDALTGLPNRFLFEDRLSHAMSVARRDRQEVALMFVDLDQFKPVNDCFGHHVGDKLLQEVARRLKECLRDSDTAARIGGDEFVVLLPNVESLPGATLVAEKILAKLRQVFELDGYQIHISASIGLAISGGSGDNEKDLTRRADAAMYQAKSSGRNHVSVARNDADHSYDWAI
jgi:diguanylate cyclase (GGDEF)-like protein/PAS domain S-box-containing protein